MRFHSYVEQFYGCDHKNSQLEILERRDASFAHHVTESAEPLASSDKNMSNNKQSTVVKYDSHLSSCRDFVFNHCDLIVPD